MYAVRIGAVAGGRDSHSLYVHSHAAKEHNMEELAVDGGKAFYCNVLCIVKVERLHGE